MTPAKAKAYLALARSVSYDRKARCKLNRNYWDAMSVKMFKVQATAWQEQTL